MRLAIYRDDVLDRYVDLSGDLRIGRAPENDVVLPDPDKGVSRFHAEVRHEHGRVVLIDLNSQNGVWLNGRRVMREIVEPDATVTIGPYRLLLEDAPSEDTQFEPTGTMPATPHPMPPLPSPGPVSTIPKTYPAIRTGSSKSRVIAALLVLVALVALVAVVVVVKLNNRVPPPPPVSQTTLPLPDKTAEDAKAKQKQIDDEFQGRVDRARSLLASEPVDALTIDAALVEINAAQELKPDSEEVNALRTTMEARRIVLAAGAPKPVPGEDKTEWPKGLPYPGKVPGETSADTRKRAEVLLERYNAAKDTLARGDSDAALSMLEKLEQDVPNYPVSPDIPTLLKEVRTKLQDNKVKQVQTYMDEARKAEQAGDLSRALQLYQRALEAGASRADATAAIDRVGQSIKAKVDEQFSIARQYAAYKKRPEEIACYEQIVKLLPPTDPRRQEAEAKLAALKGAK
jgi:tetratricopeptide (TPR) repeat protein